MKNMKTIKVIPPSIPREPKQAPPKKLANFNRSQMITKLLYSVKQLQMDEETYNAKFFDALSDSELLEFERNLFEKVDEKMKLLSKDNRFITRSLLQISSLAEKASPRYLKNYSIQLKEQEQEIEQCIQEMIDNGQLQKLQSLMRPEYKLMFILGGSMLKTVSDNVSGTTKTIQENVNSIAQQAKKNLPLSPPQSSSQPLQSPLAML